MKQLLNLGMLIMATTSIGRAEAPATLQSVKATFSIAGLHCPPCAGTVQRGLVKIKGVNAATVDYASRSAKVEFDETVASAQSIANAVAAIPHMMGGGMHYGALLALSVPEVNDNASAQKAKEALAKVPGVVKVNVYPKQHTVSVQFAAENNLTSGALIDALGKVGMKAETY